MACKTKYNLTAKWARVGVMFNIKHASKSPDLERLLLETCRHTSTNIRLLILAVTWLSRYSSLIAKHRLKHLIQTELEDEYDPIMGLMLELALEHGASEGLHTAITECTAAEDDGPLLKSMQRSASLQRFAKKQASKISLQWGRWLQPFELKLNAIRPALWIIKMNPQYAQRAAHKGDMRTSILETLKCDVKEDVSESELARLCSAYRGGVRSALDDLELEGLVHRQPCGRKIIVQLLNQAA